MSINTFLQSCLPQNYLSSGVAWFARNETRWLAQLLINSYLRAYQIDLREAERKTANQYVSLTDLFTRLPEPKARPFADDCVLASPCDGIITQLGEIQADGQILQAKNREYSVAELLGDSDRAKEFVGGSFVTIYLAPYDFHCVFTPLDLQVHELCYIKGELFSVNESTTAEMDRLYCRNKRLVINANCALGPISIVMVGALIIGGIRPSWLSLNDNDIRWNDDSAKGSYSEERSVEKGGILAGFEFGSTVVMLLPAGATKLQFKPYDELRLGQTLLGIVKDAG